MAPGHAANKPTPWVKINPDSAMDRLPQPYRLIAKVVEDVLAEVGDRIDEIGRIQKLEEYEHVLPQVHATSRLIVAGRVTCACAEARGPPRFTVGTNHGEVLVIDGRSRNGLCQKRPFGDNEAVHCIALASNGNYGNEPTAQAVDGDPAPKPTPKLLVSGSISPQILIFSMVKEQYGMLLEPACRITVPKPEVPPDIPAAAPAGDNADGEQAAVQQPPAPVQQLHATGTQGALWAVALMWDSTIRVYLCPLGAPVAPKAARGGKDSGVYESIAEDDEEAGEGGPKEHGEEFGDVAQVETPQYCFALPTFAPLRGMPEPTVGEVMLSLFAARLPGHQKDGGQAPVFCFLSSPQSSAIVAYSIWQKGPAGAGAADVQTLLSQPALPLGDIDQPVASLDLHPRRRWTLPARTTATAVSPNGAVFIAGTESGALAVVLTAAGPWLKSMLPGHYAPVRALAFHNVDVVVSVGQDAWTHHYCVSTGDLLFRCLLSPPPTPSPGTTVAATAPGGAPVVVTLDEKGNLRLFDILRGRKVAKVSCNTADPGDAFGASEAEQGHGDRIPSGLMATSACFFTFCDGTGEAEDEQSHGDTLSPDGPDADGQDAEGQAVAAGAKDDHTWIVFFDVAEMLTQLYPGIAGRVLRGDATAQDLFVSLDLQELAVAPPQNAGMGDSGSTPTNASTPKRKSTRTFTRQSSTLTSVPSAGGATPKRSGGETRKSLVQRSDSTGDSLASGLSGVGRRKTLRGKSPPGGKADSEAGVARLTAENLAGLGPGARNRARALALRGGVEASEGSQALAEPEHWRVEVRRCLRRGLVDRDKRLDSIQRRVENLRKEVEGS